MPSAGKPSIQAEANEWLLHVRPDSRYELLDVAHQNRRLALWPDQIDGIIMEEESNEYTAFELSFHLDGRVSLWFTGASGFLACDEEGILWAEKTSGTAWSKWEWNEYPMPGNDGTKQSFVRANLKAKNDRYLCCACTVPIAKAEVPCCCEEVLLNVGPAQAESSDGATNSALLANGDISTLLNVHQEGKVCFHDRESLMGQDELCVLVENPQKCQLSLYCRQLNVFVRALRDGTICSKRKTKRASSDCKFTFELPRESMAYLQSSHGSFLTAAAPYSGERSSCRFVPVSEVGEQSVWSIHAHGDNLYSIRQISAEDAVRYLVPLDDGRLYITNEPSVCFPSKSCLWSLELVSGPGRSFQGFAFRSQRHIKGRRFYLGAQPCGLAVASKSRAGRWESFSLLDFDALQRLASLQDQRQALPDDALQKSLLLSKTKKRASLQDLCKWRLAQNLELIHFHRNSAGGSSMKRCHSFSDLEEDFEGEFADLPEQFAMQVRSALRNLVPRTRSCKWKFEDDESVGVWVREIAPPWPGCYKCSSCCKNDHRLVPLEKELHPEHHRYLEVLDRHARGHQNNHAVMHIISIALASGLSLLCGSKGLRCWRERDAAQLEQPKLTMSLQSIFGDQANALQKWISFQIDR